MRDAPSFRAINSIPSHIFNSSLKRPQTYYSQTHKHPSAVGQHNTLGIFSGQSMFETARRLVCAINQTTHIHANMEQSRENCKELSAAARLLLTLVCDLYMCAVYVFVDIFKTHYTVKQTTQTRKCAAMRDLIYMAMCFKSLRRDRLSWSRFAKQSIYIYNEKYDESSASSSGFCQKLLLISWFYFACKQHHLMFQVYYA